MSNSYSLRCFHVNAAGCDRNSHVFMFQPILLNQCRRLILAVIKKALYEFK